MVLWSLTVAIRFAYFLLVEQVQSISMCSSHFGVVLCRETCSEKNQKDLDCEDSKGLTLSTQSAASPLVMLTWSVTESKNRRLLASLNFTYWYNHREKAYVFIYLSYLTNECSVVSRW